MDGGGETERARRGRWAMTAMFFANGFIVGSWAPQVPLLLTRLSISETVLGLLILLFGLGALVAMPWCGYMMARHGSRAVLRGFAVFCCFGLLAVVASGNLWVAVPAMVFLGGVIGGMDVSMNTNAVTVEKRLGRAIMSSAHGFWSLGAFVGSATGGLAIQNLGYAVHGWLVTLVALAIVAASVSHLLADVAPAQNSMGTDRRFAWPRSPLIYLIGCIALFTMIPEGAILDWAAIHMQQALQADIATASFAFAAFSATMATMRFLGDHVRNRFGAVRTLRFSSLIAALGMLVAGIAVEPWLAISAFAFAGIGIANMVPIAFSAAGNQNGVETGIGMSVVTTMGYSGILVAPSAVGFIGERTGFGPVFIGLSVLLVVVCLMSGLARSADFNAEGGPTA